MNAQDHKSCSFAQLIIIMAISCLGFQPIGSCQERSPNSLPDATTVDVFEFDAYELPREENPELSDIVLDVDNISLGLEMQILLSGPFPPLNEMDVSLQPVNADLLLAKTKWRKRPDAQTGIRVVDARTGKRGGPYRLDTRSCFLSGSPMGLV